ncbi:L,D-transpeptidase family protein [Rhodoferax sp.]|uniref:L,D-transpeptidase family protein n=1 Tax=Rhodoferax sp. TaxID=50421 RepID=UPI0039B85B2F
MTTLPWGASRGICSLVVVVVSALLLSMPVHASSKNSKAKKNAPKASAANHRSTHPGAAEARLIEVYRLTAAARVRDALKLAQALVTDYPNFQLAQLVYGDLLAAHARPVNTLGDVPAAQAQAAQPVLMELREESQMRLKALRERPPIGHIPSPFLTLPARTKHAIAVDASRSRLYLFRNNPAGLTLVADYYVSVGKAGTEKAVEGDARTPLGVYFITSNLDPKSLKEFYGSGALPINYPNALDNKRGKTGSGIWLHGTPPTQFSRAPLATDGCVVLANPDLQQIIRTVEVGTTPVVISPRLEWVPPHSSRAQVKPFEEALTAWQHAKSSGDLPRILSFYTPDFNSFGKSLPQWMPSLQSELGKIGGRAIEFKDLSMLRWTDESDTMVVTFGEVPLGTRTGKTKRQYWVRRGNEWKIFFEGVIG